MVGKVLIIGGGIANFTNVASTFKGIVRALEEFQLVLNEHNVRIFVRRGGPNYQEGLRFMREAGAKMGVRCSVSLWPVRAVSTLLTAVCLNHFEPLCRSSSTFTSMAPSRT